MKVIFLDIDGVLNTVQSEIYWGSKQENHYLLFCPITILNLNRILKEVPDVKIVISSSWRVGSTIKELKEIFSKNLIDESFIIDKTPFLGYDVDRGIEINQWLSKNSVESFVIIDDDDDMCDLSFHLFKTNPYEGLMWRCSSDIIEYLNNGVKVIDARY